MMCKMSSLMQLSPYNYERIEVVLNIIQAADDSVSSLSVGQVQTKHTDLVKLM